MAATVAAAGETSAQKGPVRLTLRILETRVKAGTGGNPWYQIELRNTGKVPIKIVDDIFLGGAGQIASRADHPAQVWLEVQPADPKKVLRRVGRVYDEIRSPNSGQLSHARTDIDGKVEAAESRWAAEGIPMDERLQRSAALRAELAAPRIRPVAWLVPGASTMSAVDRDPSHPEPRVPHEGYSELDGYLLPPGRYRVRAGYDFRHMKEAADGDRPEFRVVLKTPFIDFTVEP